MGERTVEVLHAALWLGAVQANATLGYTNSLPCGRLKLPDSILLIANLQNTGFENMARVSEL